MYGTTVNIHNRLNSRNGYVRPGLCIMLCYTIPHAKLDEAVVGILVVYRDLNPAEYKNNLSICIYIIVEGCWNRDYRYFLGYFQVGCR